MSLGSHDPAGAAREAQHLALAADRPEAAAAAHDVDRAGVADDQPERRGVLEVLDGAVAQHAFVQGRHAVADADPRVAAQQPDPQVGARRRGAI